MEPKSNRNKSSIMLQNQMQIPIHLSSSRSNKTLKKMKKMIKIQNLIFSRRMNWIANTVEMNYPQCAQKHL